MFGYILPLSTGYFPDQLKELEEKHADALKTQLSIKLKLFWIAMGGEKDIAYQNGLNVNALFDRVRHKITKQILTLPGIRLSRGAIIFTSLLQCCFKWLAPV